MTLRPEPYLRYWNDDTFGRLDRLGAMASDFGVSMAGLSLAWLHHHPDITSPIVGPRRPAHFEPVGEALDLSLSADAWAAIGELFEGERNV